MCSDTIRTAETLCAYPNCERAVWQDPDGSFSSFCGNAHRLAIRELSQNNSTVTAGGERGGVGENGGQSPSPTLCQNCNARPVYVQDGNAHPFCGRRCAAAYRQGGRQRSTSRGTANSVASRTQTQTNEVSSVNSPAATCALYGCDKPAYIDNNGVPTRFCSNRHRRESVKNGQSEACLLCATNPKVIVNGKLSDFCSRKCSDDAINAAPAILQLDKNDAMYKDVEKQFRDQWKHPTPPGNVAKIWRIISPRQAHSEFSRYQLSVERTRSVPDGNSRRRWHGTGRQCCLGDQDNESTLCSNSQCSVCGIIKSSFMITQAGKRFNYGRFGTGIYTTGTSSKANDYVVERGGSLYRAILLNDVVLGKTKKLLTSAPSLTEPPTGYDSVVGEPGGDLNYDEAVVYKNEAIRPLFVVIFSST